MYKNKVKLCTRESIPLIPDYMIPVDCCKKNASIINFTTDDMISKFELFPKNKMNNIYLAEIMGTDWLQMLDEYRDEKGTPYSDYFYFCPYWLFKYCNKISLGEDIGSAYLT